MRISTVPCFLALTLFGGSAAADALEVLAAEQLGVMESIDLVELKSANERQDALPLDRFLLDQLSIDRGRVVLEGTEPLTLRFTEPQSAVALEVDDARTSATLALTLLRGDQALGRKVFAHQVIPGSSVGRIRDGRIGVVSDRQFDGLELRRVDSQAGNYPVHLGRLRLSSDLQHSQAELRGNTGALACILPLAAAYNLSFFASLAPLPSAPVAGRAAAVANGVLKFCKPSLRALSEVERQVPAGQCEVELTQEHMAFTYSDALGIPLQSQSDWGELGTPQMLHHNTEVDVVLLAGNPEPPSAKFTDIDFFLSSASLDASDKIYESCREDGSVRYSQFEGSGPEYECPFVEDRTLAFPVGSNTVVWRANPRLSPVDLIDLLLAAFYFPGVPPGAKADPFKRLLINIWRETAITAFDEQINGWRLPNAQIDFQEITVFDEIPPTITPLPGSQGNATAELVGQTLHVTIEADEVGGVSRRRYEAVVRSFLDVSDACDRPTTLSVDYPSEALRSFWPVSTDSEDNAFHVTWSARDPGPNLNGNTNLTIAAMRIEVLDRQPPTLVPPPDIVEIDTQQVNDLGQAAVFDLVDLSPQVSNDADLPLGLGLHEVTWTAIDAGGNTSQAVQIVNVKASNIPPVALDQTGAGRPDAVSFEPTPIRLQGNDPDGDPLRFKIEDVPENGFFVAPLHPYFIEDFRIEQSISDTELDDLCTSGLEAPNGAFELEFPSEPIYITVTDQGDTFVVDLGSINCSAGDSERFQRLARFNPDGSLHSTERVNGFDFREVVFDVSSGSIVTTSVNGTGVGFIRIYDIEFNPILDYGLTNVRDWNGDCSPIATGGCDIEYAKSAVVDDLGLLYLMNFTGRIFALDAQQFGPTVFIDYLSDDVDNTQPTWVDAGSLAIDSEGFVYAARNDRIYKYEPGRVDSEGRVVPGEPVGWLGRCDIDLAPGDQAVCDVANHRSLGFSCTDDICGVDDAFNAGEQTLCDSGVVQNARNGCRPGQFRGTPQGLDIAPDGTIYVADSFNARIQRFTPDGFFAGQARSTGSGSGFVIGDFGNPENVSVNSSRFYILDTATNLLHISLLTPFVEIGDDYADLVYQSNNDFACDNSTDCIDLFSFQVSDGVRDPETGQPEVSAPAEVEVEVNRNFRAPFATPGVAAVVTEDIPETFVLDGSDPDPIDNLAFEVVAAPVNGSVSIDGNEATYTPDADYWGPDEFSFRVDDGNESSAPETVQLEIIEINDAPIISVPDEAIEGGTGFAVELELAFRDPDPDENHTVVVDWGDGTVESEGEFDEDGNPTGPILGHGGTDSGRISAEHIFLTAGSKDVEVCVTDRMQLDGNDDEVPTPGLSLTACENIPFSIVDGIDLGLSAEASTDVALPGQSVNYEFEVNNRQPDEGLGLTATGIELVIRLPSGFDSSSITTPPGCTRDGYWLNCSVSDLAPGQTALLNVTAEVAGDTPSGRLLVTEAEVGLDQTPINPELSLLLTTPVSRPADYQVGATGDALKDESDANPGDGICASVDGVCTLRAAVEEAAESTTPKVIALANGLYVLRQTLSADVLRISGNVVLIGNGPDKTRIQGKLQTLTGTDLRLENLTLSGRGLTAAPVDSLTVRRVRFTGNEKLGSFGAAILTDAAALDIRDTTFDNNVTDVDGGSLMCFSCSGIMENVTVTGGSGGGLTFTGSGQVDLRHLTIVGTGGGSGWSLPTGGALHVYDDMDVTIANSVVAGNYSTGTANNCAIGNNASLVSQGNNAFGDLTGCDISPLASDLSITNARLQPLATGLDGLPVRLPKADSPLIDVFDDASCLATDARGLTRPRDGNDDGISWCDIGAVERRSDQVFRDRFRF